MPTRDRSVSALSPLARAVAVALLAVASTQRAAAQGGEITFSLDLQGPSMGNVTPSGLPITDADLLVTTGDPFAPGPPEIFVPGAFLAAYNNCQGHLPGIACGLEINALSFGRDARIQPFATYAFDVYISVDEFAQGIPPSPQNTFPTVFTEAQQSEAAADIFGSRFVGPGPFQPIPRDAVGVADGNGAAASPQLRLVRGLGLPEPIPADPTVPDLGDNVDAFDVGSPFDPANDRIYFSLQGGFASCSEPGAPIFDAAALQPLAAGGNARSSDVLVFEPGVGVRGYAGTQELGLGLFGPDDIDALVVVDNGNGVYDAPTAPYSWATTATPTDLVLFSLRCNSATIGQLDPVSGLTISQGDVLLKLPGSPIPTVFIPAEALGLETVSRGGMFDDELDGLDITDPGGEPWVDCNGNGREDTIDILLGGSMDDDSNGIPDECERPDGPSCTCETGTDAVCGNVAGPGRGCANATGLGASMIGGGTTSIVSDALTLDIADVPPLTFGLMFMGAGAVDVDLGNGRRCVGAPGQIYRFPIFQASIGGMHTAGPGLLATAAGLAPAPSVTIGSTYGFQAWYRDNLPSDPAGPCDFGSNLTNAITVTFTP